MSCSLPCQKISHLLIGKSLLVDEHVQAFPSYLEGRPGDQLPYGPDLGAGDTQTFTNVLKIFLCEKEQVVKVHKRLHPRQISSFLPD